MIHLFPLPALAVYVLFMIIPVFTALGYSLFDWHGMVRGDFIGLKNFVTLFTDPQLSGLFKNAIGHNVIYFLVSLVVQNAAAFYLAYLIYRKYRGAEWFKVIFFVPRLLSLIVVGFLWNLILNPNFGAFNALLRTIGLEEWALPWLGQTSTALYAIILVNAWYMIGFGILIYLAGLQAIPQDILEAAELDGCIGFEQIRKIILPLLMPSITIMTILTFIYSFEAFDLIFAMEGSEGGPYYSTDTLATLFYRLSFAKDGASSAIGLGSALAVVMFVIIASVSAISLYLMTKRSNA
ncbi:ABC transporter permease [Effusibacillus lacus]|uniref:ABC transporter permease n=1 Tax=Effusibacillus lacus TaxID=1348429 RepID=A0A292YP67_9BACL|nr:ABC transporter permease [Effusibacillus lacus]